MLGPSVKLDQGMAGATHCGSALLLQLWESTLVIGPLGVIWVGKFVPES